MHSSICSSFPVAWTFFVKRLSSHVLTSFLQSQCCPQKRNCVKTPQAERVQTVHAFIMHNEASQRVNQKGRGDNGALWVSTDRAGVCYFCLPIGLHVRDNRERPLPMFAQRVPSKCAPCICTVCVPSAYAIKECGRLCRSHCVCVPYWVCRCTSCLTEIWTFPLVLDLFWLTPPFLWHTHIIRKMKAWEECLRKEWRLGGREVGSLLLFSLTLHSITETCAIALFWSTWQFLPKVREQSPFWGEEVKLSVVLQFISFP